MLDSTFTYISIRTYAKRNKMAPKKPVVEEKILLGRPGNNLKSGIVRRFDVPAVLQISDMSLLLGWTRECRQVNAFSGHHKE